MSIFWSGLEIGWMTLWRADGGVGVTELTGGIECVAGGACGVAVVAEAGGTGARGGAAGIVVGAGLAGLAAAGVGCGVAGRGALPSPKTSWTTRTTSSIPT